MSIADLLFDRATAFIPVLLSLTVHEWAHAWAAWRLGDDTAKMLGRLTLNPVDHIDPIGTLALPLLGVPFGWAKPVPINPTRFRTGVSMPTGVLLVALAGPVSNLLLAVVAGLALGVLNHHGAPATWQMLHPEARAAVGHLLEYLVTINVILACFNLLPIPPLDGSRVVDALMPSGLRRQWNEFCEIGPLMLASLIVLPSLLGVCILAWPLACARDLVTWITG